MKDPLLAGVLSFLFPGLGHLYVGDFFRGLMWFIAILIGYVCFIVPGVILYIINIWDANNQAIEFNKKEKSEKEK